MTQTMSAARIDLIILDIMMPGEWTASAFAVGYARTEQFRRSCSRQKGQSSIECSASKWARTITFPSHLASTSCWPAFVSVLRRAAMPVPGSPAGARRVFEFAGWRLDVLRRELRSPANALVDLRAAEFDVLLVLVEHPQRVLSRDQLLDLGCGRGATTFDRTIDLYISRLRRRLEADPEGACADQDDAERGIHPHHQRHPQRSALVMRRPDSVTTTIWLAVVVAMVLGFSLQRAVTTVLPYFGFERQQQLPRSRSASCYSFRAEWPHCSISSMATPVADRPTVLATAQLPQVRLRLLDAPAPNLGNRGEPDAEAVRRRIEMALSAPRPVIVADRYRLADAIVGPAGGRSRTVSGSKLPSRMANGFWW